MVFVVLQSKWKNSRNTVFLLNYLYNWLLILHTQNTWKVCHALEKRTSDESFLYDYCTSFSHFQKESLSNSTSLGLSVLVAHINFDLEELVHVLSTLICVVFVAVVGENSWWRYSRFYTFRSLWVHSRLPYVLLWPRPSVEVLWMDFTKRWRGLWLIHRCFTEHQENIAWQWCSGFP